MKRMDSFGLLSVPEAADLLAAEHNINALVT